MKKKDITIYELADELNVAPSTVSRALRNHFSIGSDTRRRVIELAAERGYRSKQGKKSGIIALIKSDEINNQMIKGIEKVANEHGFRVVIARPKDGVSNEVALAELLSGTDASGLVVLLTTEATAHLYNFDPQANNSSQVN